MNRHFSKEDKQMATITSFTLGNYKSKPWDTTSHHQVGYNKSTENSKN